MTRTLLDTLYRNGHLRTLDHALAQSLRRLDPDTPDSVLAAAALASLAVSKGHAGVKPCNARALLDSDDADIAWPHADGWRTTLAASRWVSTPDDPTRPADTDAPLVLEGDLLYLRRYREYERALANGLHRIASHAVPQTNIAALAPLFAQLFPATPIPTLPPQAGEGQKAPPAPPLPQLAQEGQKAALALPLPPLAGEGRDGGALPTQDHRARAAAPALPLPSHAEEGQQQAPAQTLLRHAGEGARGAEEGKAADDHQAHAAALALRHALLLVTGGPGTGKTTTVARLLVLLAAQARNTNAPAPRIALAAPTGRAAERMAESVRNALQSLAGGGIHAHLLDTLPTSGSTLHRLLGTLPDTPRFRHHADNPLPFDVVVVDEASMIDLPLMAKLVDAVADGARLILLGDPDQLPSVEAGDVLAAILQAAGDGSTLTPGDAEALQPLLRTGPIPGGASIRPHEDDGNGGDGGGVSGSDRGVEGDATATHTSPASGRGRAAGAGEGPPFPGRRIHLARGYRQSESLQLAPLAAAVREGDARNALALLRSNTLSNVHFHEGLADPLQAHGDRLLAHWRSLAQAETPVEALARASRLRVLTAVRDGPQGARSLNARIEALLSEGGDAAAPRRGARHFHGQPIIVTENSYRHRLFNGDTGILHRDANGTLMAWFPGDEPRQPRAFHPATLPAHDSAFAMTVHKAQGSEFDSVWLLLPTRDNRVLSRELVYTGITRARRELHLAATGDVIRAALSRHASRWSGLAWRLSSG
ncbi:exodeoxyribonuclease V subunit alpha [Luteimonas aestuarii]|uniref:RecBCD enzyme subunit RecD n=1 Tax=Luteimonas aestuarii TaxID=453837 RepID=A0A4R5TM95_9GAMM|nr:AAA family ATPase [Luteimonas aestuarii]TDK23763.1 exodeoxyribonuclease V subunit alpha [Luteimonas aestuarii]